MKTSIKFGTDGWRGVIAKDFTFDNLSLVSYACANQFLEDLKQNNKGKATLPLQNLVFVGYDRRFLGKEFAKCTASILSQNGLNVSLYNEDVPTPMVSFDVKKNNAVSGIVITASHNPPEFSGFKIKQAGGFSAKKEYTNKIEQRLTNVEAIHELPLPAKNNFQTIEPSKNYLDYIKKTIDIEKLKNLSETVIVDSMYGCGGNYIENFLNGGKLKVQTIRAKKDVTFGGMNPEPMMPQLIPLSKEVLKNKALIGLATDGDADRIGAVDENGEYITTHKLLAILLCYLIEKRNLLGGIVLTVSQSFIVKKMAKHYGLKLYEVPVGFKNIADLMLTDDILIGAEEANGIGCKLHFMPERDGIFNGLLILEAISSFNLKPSKLIEKIHSQFGSSHYDRVDIKIPSSSVGLEFVEKIKTKAPSQINGFKVKDIQTLDGTKLIFEDESWLLFRASGTEPVLRIYSEATNKDMVSNLLQAGQNLFPSGVRS